MSHRQKFYIGLAVTAGVCSTVGLILYFKYRRERTERRSKENSTSNLENSTGYVEITNSTEDQTENPERIRIRTPTSKIEFDFPEGETILTLEQSIVLTNFLDETNEIRLNQILTTISNLGTLTQNQENLANAGCIERLEKLLSSNENETTRLKIIFALNNLSLNPKTIERFRKIVRKIIEISRNLTLKSLIRRYALQLLVNLSLFDDLHDEFVENLSEISDLIESSRISYDEEFQLAKILVNLSTNKSNIESLFKLTGVELKTIVNYCTPSKKSNNEDQTEKLEDLLLRYLTFYCNLIENVVEELKKTNENTNLIKSWLTDPLPYGQGALYFELFDQNKQMASKTILRPRFFSNDVNQKVARFRQALEKLIQIQFDSTLINTQNEFNQNEIHRSVSDASTPKRNLSENSDDFENKENLLNDFSKEMTENFDENDETILPGPNSPSDQSLASFRSALSVNENHFCSSPEKSNFGET